MRIGIVYGHVASNIGDLAINRGVVGLLNRVAPDAHAHIVFLNPNDAYLSAAEESFVGLRSLSHATIETRGGHERFVDRHRCSLAGAAAYIEQPLKFLEDTGLADCDAILYNSGEHLFSYEGRRSHPDLVWRVLPALAARAAGIRFITLPATFGPFENRKMDGLFRAFFRLNHAFAAREPRSAVLVEEFTGAAELPTLLDPAFFAEMPAVKQPGDRESLGIIMRLEGVGLRAGKPASAETTRHLAGGIYEGASLRFAVDASLRFIEETGGEVKLFVQSGSNDRALTMAIADALAASPFAEHCHLIEPTSVEDYQKELSSIGLVVAARFHACILGVVAGTPVMGVYFSEHGHKMPGLFELLGVPDHCQLLTDDSAEQAAASISLLYRGREEAFSGVADRVDSLRDETARWLSEALQRDCEIMDQSALKAAADEVLDAVRAMESTLPSDAPAKKSRPTRIQRLIRRLSR